MCVPHRHPLQKLAVVVPPLVGEWWNDVHESSHNQAEVSALALAHHQQYCIGNNIVEIGVGDPRK